MIAIFLYRKNKYNIEYATKKTPKQFNDYIIAKKDKLIALGFYFVQGVDVETGEMVINKQIRNDYKFT